MGHLVAAERWGDVDLDTTTGRVFVQENWHYNWLTWPGVTQHWTYPQKHAFHRAVDIGVWRAWSNHLHLRVNGNAPFASRLIPVNFDVRWKLAAPFHWNVDAWKVPVNATPTTPVRSQVDWNNFTIRLSTADLGPRSAGNAAGQSTGNFITPPHEFGHTMFLPDEYNAGSPNLNDQSSIMNIGREIRARHLIELVRVLNRLMPHARFAA